MSNSQDPTNLDQLRGLDDAPLPGVALAAAIDGRLIHWTPMMQFSRAVAAGVFAGRRYVLRVEVAEDRFRWEAEQDGVVLESGLAFNADEAVLFAELAYAAAVNAESEAVT